MNNPYETICFTGRDNEQRIYTTMKRIVRCNTNLLIFSPVEERYSDVITYFRNMGVEVSFFTDTLDLRRIVRDIQASSKKEEAKTTCLVFDVFEKLNADFDTLLRNNRTYHCNVIVNVDYIKDLSPIARTCISTTL